MTDERLYAVQAGLLVGAGLLMVMTGSEGTWRDLVRIIGVLASFSRAAYLWHRATYPAVTSLPSEFTAETKAPEDNEP